MSEFGAADWSVPVSGNIGVRYVSTTVDATGYRSEVTVTPSVGGSAATITVIPGTLTRISDSADYDYFLPSLNLSFDLSDADEAALRGLSRAVACRDRGVQRRHRANRRRDRHHRGRRAGELHDRQSAS